MSWDRGKGDTQNIAIPIGPNTDNLGQQIVVEPEPVFDAQFTYDLQPLAYEQVTAESGASIAHDTTNRQATMTFSSTPTGGQAYMQSYEYAFYQAGRTQRAIVTFNFEEATANCLKFAGVSDGSNGIEIQHNGTQWQAVLYSDTAYGDQTIGQTSWNLDTLDGNGPSGKTLDISKGQILVVEYLALYRDSIRLGFKIENEVIFAHEFLFANMIAPPYIQQASLPIRCGMTCTGTVSTTMDFTCSAIQSLGGVSNINGYEFAQEGTGTAGDGASAHILSLRPKTTFNSITNRIRFTEIEVSVANTGSNPIFWQLVIGQAISGTTTYNDCNATYSAYEYNTAGTASGSPAIVIDQGYVPASNQSKGAADMTLTSRYPITLDAAGAVRALGTLSVVATGIGGTSATRCAIKWKEIR